MCSIAAQRGVPYLWLYSFNGVLMTLRRVPAHINVLMSTPFKSTGLEHGRQRDQMEIALHYFVTALYVFQAM
jgi:hypothetical protein